MRLSEVKKLVESTSDAAFAVDRSGLIVAWNLGAAEMFGVSEEEALDQPCGSILQGMDECGRVCSEDCTVQQAVRNCHPVSNFDLQVETPKGRQWCNVSVLVADEDSEPIYSLHIIRQVDVRKRLEMLMRDFLVMETNLPAEETRALIARGRTPARETELTDREIEILRRLARGETTARIADELNISRTTVNNHVQHILRKLDAHTRLEAIRRAEHAGLL